MKIYFVRHGETDANLLDIEQNEQGKLTELGRKQASFVGKRFSNIPVDLIISSPYPRTRETAEIINESLGKEIIYSDLFVEYRMPSIVVGKPIRDEATVKICKTLAKNYHTDERHSDEENFSDLKDRVKKALDFISSQKVENILVITHGMFVRMLVGAILLGTDITSQNFEKIIYALKAKNTGITFAEFIQKHDGPNMPGWKLVTWNDHAHLGEAK